MRWPKAQWAREDARFCAECWKRAVGLGVVVERELGMLADLDADMEVARNLARSAFVTEFESSRKLTGKAKAIAVYRVRVHQLWSQFEELAIDAVAGGTGLRPSYVEWRRQISQADRARWALHILETAKMACSRCGRALWLEPIAGVIADEEPGDGWPFGIRTGLTRVQWRRYQSSEIEPLWLRGDDGRRRLFGALACRCRIRFPITVLARQNVSKATRQLIFNRDRGRCHLCHKPVDPLRFHIDHLIPLSAGGTHNLDNLAISHSTCNLSKSSDWSRHRCISQCTTRFHFELFLTEGIVDQQRALKLIRRRYKRRSGVYIRSVQAAPPEIEVEELRDPDAVSSESWWSDYFPKTTVRRWLVCWAQRQPIATLRWSDEMSSYGMTPSTSATSK